MEASIRMPLWKTEEPQIIECGNSQKRLSSIGYPSGTLALSNSRHYAINDIGQKYPVALGKDR